MHEWVLGIELNGEWEHCSFGTRQEALASFEALRSDYEIQIDRAILFRHGCPHKGAAVAPKPAHIS